METYRELHEQVVHAERSRLPASETEAIATSTDRLRLTGEGRQKARTSDSSGTAVVCLPVRVGEMAYLAAGCLRKLVATFSDGGAERCIVECWQDVMLDGMEADRHPRRSQSRHRLAFENFRLR